jgi:hypothetical protein
MDQYADNNIDTRMGSVPMGSPMDPMDHIADSGHNDTMNPGRAQMADASVTRLHPPGTFLGNTNSGDSVNAVAKALNIGPPANVIRFPKK